MTHRIEVAFKEGLGDPREAAIAGGIRDLGIRTIEKVAVADVYWLDADLTSEALGRVCLRLLSDPVAQVYRHDGGHISDTADCLCALEVTYNSGVSDPLEATILKGIADIDAGPVPRAKNGVLYVLHGQASQSEIQLLTDQLLLNPVVQHVVQPGEDVFPHEPTYELSLRHICITQLQNDELLTLAREFGFSPTEMEAIQRLHRTGAYRRRTRDPGADVV